MEILADVRPEENQDLEGALFNVSFPISNNARLCVALRYLGGNPDISRNYRLDHLNVWKDGFGEPESISRQGARKILRGQRILLSDAPIYLE